MNSLFPNLTPEQKKLAAWQACQPVQQLSPAHYRVDAYGHLICWADYGTLGEYGWEIDHRHPSALGGSDGLHNLRALHWRKNRELGGLLGGVLNALDAATRQKRHKNPFGF